MTTVVIVTFICILSLIHGQQLLISQLNTFFSIEHNIFLLDSSVDLNRFINNCRHEDYTPRSLYVSSDIYGNVSGLDHLSKIRSKNELLVLAPNSSDFENNLNLLARVKKVQRLHLQIKIGVFYSHISNEDLRKLFQWSWKNRIINIFAAAYAELSTRSNSEELFHIFTYNPFGTFRVLNVTGRSFDNVFLSQKSNFHKYQLQLGEKANDFDRSAKLWQTVFRVMNASYKYLDKFTTLNSNSTIDIFTKLYTKTDLIPNNIYPLGMSTFSILVPAALPYSEFGSYLQNIVSNKFLIYSTITIVTIVLTLGITRFIKQRKIVIFESVVDVVSLLINDNYAVKYEKLSRMEGFIIVPLTFVGLVIMNGILSNLQSHITRPFLQPEINTAEDIYRSPLPVLTHNSDLRKTLIEMLTNSTEYTDWNDKVLILELSELEQQRKVFNTSAMYVTVAHVMRRLLNVQKQVQIRGYHVAQKGILRSIVCHLVHEECPFLELINEIVHRIQSAGLYELWFRQDDVTFEKMILDGLKINRFENGNVTEVENFPMPKFLFYGWTASLILLVIEIIWFKLTRKFADTFGSLMRR